MSDKHSGGRVLRRVNIGFALILAVNWAAEVADLPHQLYGDPSGFNWFRVLLRSAVILGVWGWAYFTLRPLVRRLRHLEEFMLVCSWCRKVGHEGEWLTMEQFFGSKFDAQTSHGVCPTCAAQARARMEKQFTEARDGS